MTEILDLCVALPEKRFSPGEELLTQETLGGELYVLVEGMVAVTKNGIEVARISNPGAVFGEMSVLLSIPVSATVTAMTNVRTRLCADPLAYIQTNPQFALHTARLLAVRLQNTTTYLADLKAQFGDQGDHLGMVDTILEAMVEQQSPANQWSNRSDDPRL